MENALAPRLPLRNALQSGKQNPICFSYANNLVKVFTFDNSNYTFEEEPQMKELMGNQPARPKVYLTSFQGASPLSSRMNFSHAVYKCYNPGTPGPRDHLTWIIPSGVRAPLLALDCNHCCFCAPNQGVGLGIHWLDCTRKSDQLYQATLWISSNRLACPCVWWYRNAMSKTLQDTMPRSTLRKYSLWKALEKCRSKCFLFWISTSDLLGTWGEPEGTRGWERPGGQAFQLVPIFKPWGHSWLRSCSSLGHQRLPERYLINVL